MRVRHRDPYAIPALIAAALAVAVIHADVCGLSAALGAAAICFAIRMLGVVFKLNAPGPHGACGVPDAP